MKPPTVLLPVAVPAFFGQTSLYPPPVSGEFVSCLIWKNLEAAGGPKHNWPLASKLAFGISARRMLRIRGSKTGQVSQTNTDEEKLLCTINFPILKPLMIQHKTCNTYEMSSFIISDF